MFFLPVTSSCSPIERLPRWRIGECWPDMVGTEEIKYPDWPKYLVASSALQKIHQLVKGERKKTSITNYLVLQVGGEALGAQSITLQNI